jgi:quercetin 2,3-dioxygenase
MKSFLILFSILIAILSATYKETIVANLDTLFTASENTTITTAFKAIPRALYGAPKPANMTVSRAIRKAFLAVEQSEGVGAKVRRSIGTPQLRNFSPFLMLDHFSIKPGAGFPDHPHRGQESKLPQSLTLTGMY